MRDWGGCSKHVIGLLFGAVGCFKLRCVALAYGIFPEPTQTGLKLGEIQ